MDRDDPRRNEMLGFDSLRQASDHEPVASQVIEASYALTTTDLSNPAVPPDGRTGLVLVDGRVWWLGPQSGPWRPERGNVHVLGVRIAMQWGQTVLGRSLHSYRNARLPADELWGADAAHSFPSNLLATTSMNRLIGILNRRVSGKSIDPSIEHITSLVRTGELSVAEMAVSSGLSVRQLHRQCLKYFGLPPSKLLRINRLQRAAAQVQRLGNPGLAELAVGTGYFDQAHLSRETRELVGERPSTAFAVASNVRFVQYSR